MIKDIVCGMEIETPSTFTLTPNKTIPIEFKPDTLGEYEFQCAMGMLRGKLIVE